MFSNGSLKGNTALSKVPIWPGVIINRLGSMTYVTILRNIVLCSMVLFFHILLQIMTEYSWCKQEVDTYALKMWLYPEMAAARLM